MTEGIDRIEPRGIVTQDGQLHELDVLVLATGFRAHQWGVDLVVGADGRSLKEAWAQGERTYRSITIPGFPNFFMMCGPNSPIGNISVIDVSETQANYIVECLEKLANEQGKALVPKRSASEKFNTDLLEAMKDTLWVTGCASWYLDDEGIPVLWPWSARRFHQDMRHPRFADYDLVPAN